MELGIIYAGIGAVVAVVLAGIGSAIGVASSGQAGAGVVGENPDAFSRVLVLQALPGTQGIYGLMIGFLIIQKLGLLAGSLAPVNETQGLLLLMGGAIMGLAGLLSAVYQGKCAVAGIGMIGRRPNELGKAVTMTVLVETYAVLALLGAFLIVNGVKL